jgi:ribosomal protein S27AE
MSHADTLRALGRDIRDAVTSGAPDPSDAAGLADAAVCDAGAAAIENLAVLEGRLTGRVMPRLVTQSERRAARVVRIALQILDGTASPAQLAAAIDHYAEAHRGFVVWFCPKCGAEVAADHVRTDRCVACGHVDRVEVGPVHVSTIVRRVMRELLVQAPAQSADGAGVPR